MAAGHELGDGHAASGAVAHQLARTPPATPDNVDLCVLLDTSIVIDEEPSSEIACMKQLSDGLHYSFDFADAWAIGRAEFCSLGDGMFVHMMDAELQHPHPMQVSGPDMMRIRIASEGTGEYVPPQGEAFSVDGPGAIIIIEPAGVGPADALFEGRNRSVQVYAHKSALQRLYGRGKHELPGVLQAFMDGSLQRTVVRRLPLTSSLLRCLEDLLGSTQEGTTRRLYIQSKAIEIFCLAFEGLEDDEGFGSAEASMVTTRGVLRAQQILMERFVSPPTLDDLANEVALSRTSLSAGFRQILGQSVFDYIQDLRMQHALALLNQRGASITQVAYAVGYNHASSFTVAVQRRFGATPRELRKRGALPGI
jgi:AraC family transcriptional activator of pyochelin receptor